MSMSYARASRLASICHKEFDFQFFVYQEEVEYKTWLNSQRFNEWLHSLPRSVKWNCIMCVMSLVGIVLSSLDIGIDWRVASPLEAIFDISYNVVYAVHALGYLNDNSLSGSVVGTILKYIYLFMLMRVTFALYWLHILRFQHRRNNEHHSDVSVKAFLQYPFYWSIYIVAKMFNPVGSQIIPDNDVERMSLVFVTLTGTFCVTGIATATLAIFLFLTLNPEEAFRARLKLIIKDMQEANIPKSLHKKVETFYRMYWHKQRGVSSSDLMLTFPPTTINLIYSEIYFEAQQRSLILRDLSNQFLSEVAKLITTINYIPGDTIIKRKNAKDSIIYIAYGDVEMMTAEDDETPILRFSRGTILNGCGGCPTASCARAHVEIRAATFCTVHQLKAGDLWNVISKFGKSNGQAFIVLSAFNEHFERVKRHFARRTHQNVSKSSILIFKRNLVELKKITDASGKRLLQRTDVFLQVAGCYVMRNCADAALTEESDRICLRSRFPCILQPTSSLQVAWSCYIAVLTFIVTLTYPYYMFNQPYVSSDFYFYDYVISVVFVLDIIAHLSTGAKIEEGVPVTFRQTSSVQMTSVWFALDVLAVLPIFQFVGNSKYSGLNKLLKLPMFFRSLKHLEDATVAHRNVIRFMAYTLCILITTYLIATAQLGFMCNQFKYCEVTNFKDEPYWSETPMNPDNEGSRLYFAVYWAISMYTNTSHRTANWMVQNFIVRAFVLVVLEICMVMVMLIESAYSAVIMVALTMRSEYEFCILGVKNFLIRNNVDPKLRHRFINYLQLCWLTDKAYSITHKKQSVLFDLPPHVSVELLAKQRIRYIRGLPFAKYVSEKVLTEIASAARLFYTSPNEILLNTGDIINELYVLKQGICEVLDPDTKKVVNLISTKSHFGVIESLLRIPTFYTVRAVTHVQVLCISTRILNYVINMPGMQNAITFAKEQKEYINLKEGRKPFIKYMMPPPIPNIQKFPLLRKHELDVAFILPFQRLGFLSLLRYVFPRFTIRPDGTYMQRYEWFRGLCALLSAFLYPGYVYLVLQFPSLFYLTYFLDFTAYFDILQRMLVAYYDDKGILVYHPAWTAAHYLKGAFILDLLACLPMEILDEGRKYHYTFRRMFLQLAYVQYLMFNRLLQLYRLPSALNTLSGHIRDDVLLLIKGTPLFLTVLHVMTTYLALNSVAVYAPIEGGEWKFFPLELNVTWLDKNQSSFRFDIMQTPFNLHIQMFFWSVYEATSTGYNCFYPFNKRMVAIIFWGKIVAAMVLTYFAVRVISIRGNVNKGLVTFQEHMRDMVVFMKREKVSDEIQKDLLNFYTYTWNKMGGTNYRTVLKMCDQISLRTDAIMHIYGQTFAKCPILLKCDVSLLRLMGRGVHSMYFLRGTRIIETDDVIGDIYFVDYGTIAVKKNADAEEVITRLPRGSIFGNMEVSPTIRSTNSFVSDSNVHLLRINTVSFHRILNEFPAVIDLLQQFRPNQQIYIIGGQRDPSARMSVWKEKALSTAIIMATRKGAIKFLDEHAKSRHVYLIIVSLLSVYFDTYNAAHQGSSPSLVLILYILDMAFFLKILVNYTLPKVDFENQEVKLNLLRAKKQYYQGVFKWDILSCIPIELLCFLADKENQWYYFSFLRLNRIFRLATVSECIRLHHEKMNINLTLSTLTAIVIWFSVFIHTCTCTWNYIGDFEDRIEPNSSWRNLGPDIPPCQNRYMCSFYFIFMNFMNSGVEDILPRKHSEVIFSCILQIVSKMLYMIYVGEFSTIIQYQSFRFFEFYTLYVELRDFLKCNRVTKNLMSMMYKYSLYLWQENRGRQVPYFLETAPQYLHSKVMSAVYMHHFEQHPTFQSCEPAFLRQLVRHFRRYSYDEAMYIVKENEVTNSMYFIHNGYVEERAEDLEEQTETLYTGQYFGLLQGLQRGTPFSNSYKTLDKSQVLTLTLDDWEYLLEHFPQSKAIIYKDYGDDTDNELDKERKRVEFKSAKIQARTDETIKNAKTAKTVDGEVEENTFIGLYPPTGRRSTSDEDIEELTKMLKSKTKMKLAIKTTEEEKTYGEKEIEALEQEMTERPEEKWAEESDFTPVEELTEALEAIQEEEVKEEQIKVREVTPEAKWNEEPEVLLEEELTEDPEVKLEEQVEVTKVEVIPEVEWTEPQAKEHVEVTKVTPDEEWNEKPEILLEDELTEALEIGLEERTKASKNVPEKQWIDEPQLKELAEVLESVPITVTGETEPEILETPVKITQPSKSGEPSADGTAFDAVEPSGQILGNVEPSPFISVVKPTDATDDLPNMSTETSNVSKTEKHSYTHKEEPSSVTETIDIAEVQRHPNFTQNSPRTTTEKNTAFKVKEQLEKPVQETFETEKNLQASKRTQEEEENEDPYQELKDRLYKVASQSFSSLPSRSSSLHPTSSKEKRLSTIKTFFGRSRKSNSNFEQPPGSVAGDDSKIEPNELWTTDYRRKISSMINEIPYLAEEPQERESLPQEPLLTTYSSRKRKSTVHGFERFEFKRTSEDEGPKTQYSQGRDIDRKLIDEPIESTDQRRPTSILRGSAKAVTSTTTRTQPDYNRRKSLGDRLKDAANKLKGMALTSETSRVSNIDAQEEATKKLLERLKTTGFQSAQTSAASSEMMLSKPDNKELDINYKTFNESLAKHRRTAFKEEITTYEVPKYQEFIEESRENLAVDYNANEASMLAYADSQLRQTVLNENKNDKTTQTTSKSKKYK